MRRLMTILIALLVVLLLATAGAIAALHRPDIPLATLKERYATPASRYVELPDGVVVHYRDQGDPSRPVLVLVHGYSASTDTWTPWVRALEARYRLISLDLPGHGLTDAPAGFDPTIDAYVEVVKATLDALQIGKVNLVGSSMGGHVAWRFAATYPDRSTTLVLVDAAGWRTPAIDDRPRPFVFTLFTTPVIGPLLRDIDTTALVRRGLQDSVVRTSIVDDAMVHRYVDMSRGPGRRAMLLRIITNAANRPLASTEALAPIRVPTLILHGDRDTLVPVEHATLFNQAIVGSQLRIFPGVGHIPQEEIPDVSAGELDTFLRGVLEPAVPPSLLPPLPGQVALPTP